MIDIIKGEGLAAGKPFPMVVALGSDAYDIIKGAVKVTENALEEWKEVTVSTDFTEGA